MKSWLLGAITLAALGWLLTHSGNQINATSLVVIMVQILLEVAAIPQREFGFFSSSYAWALGTFLVIGGPSSAIGILLGLALRSAWHPRKYWKEELLCDGLPMAASLAAAQMLYPPSAGLWPSTIATALAVYLPMAALLPDYLAESVLGDKLERWQAVRQLSGSYFVAIGFSGPILAYLMQQNAWMGFWMLPILFSLHRASRTELIRLEELDLDQLRIQADKTQQSLSTTKRHLESAKTQIKTQVNERLILEQLVSELLSAPSRQQCLRRLLVAIKHLTSANSVVFFQIEEADRLTAEIYLSPFSDRLENERLIGLREPVVEQAWKTGQMISGASPTPQTRIFQEEKTAVAIPIAQEGVLYVGRLSNQPFNDHDFNNLTRIAALAALALQSSERSAACEHAIELYRRTNQQLSRQVDSFSVLLEAARGLLSLQSLEARFDRFRQLLDLLVPFEGVIILNQGEVNCLLPKDWRDSLDHPALQRILRPILDYQKPLLLENLSETRMTAPVAGTQSLLGVPLGDEESLYGAILLLSRQRAAFQRSHQELMMPAAYLLMAALRSSEKQSQIDFYQAQELENSKQMAVGQLAAGIAHEINSPLAAIVLQISLAIKHSQNPDTVQAKLQIAQQASQRVQSIVSRLLYYTEESQNQWRIVDLSEILRDSIELANQDWARAQVELDVDIQCLSKASLVGSPHQLYQLFITLSDQIRRTAGPGGRVKISATQQPDQIQISLQLLSPASQNPLEISPRAQAVVLASAHTIAEKHRAQLTQTADGFQLTFHLGDEPQ